MFEIKELAGMKKIVNGKSFELSIYPEYHNDMLEFIVESLNSGLTKRAADLCQMCGTMVSLSANKCLVCGTSR